MKICMNENFSITFLDTHVGLPTKTSPHGLFGSRQWGDGCLFDICLDLRSSLLTFGRLKQASLCSHLFAALNSRYLVMILSKLTGLKNMMPALQSLKSR